jgi:hypothetical protein
MPTLPLIQQRPEALFLGVIATGALTWTLAYI